MLRWLRLFVLSTLVLFAVFTPWYVFRGRTMGRALLEGAAWALITAGIYVAAKRYHTLKRDRSA